MKNILCLVLLALAATIPFRQASAQGERLAANIPFAFHVGQKVLPAGSYTITPDLMRNMISVAGNDPQAFAASLSMHDPYTAGRSNLLVFHKYGSQYFLHRVVRSHSEDGILLLAGKAEKQARREEQMAGLPVLDPVILALNESLPTLPER